MRTYAFPAIVERGETTYGAFFPDLPGCGTVGDTMSELAEMAREALSFHLSGMLEDGESIPEPTPMEALPQDAEVRQVGTMLVSATPGSPSQIILTLPTTLLHRADEVAASAGQTREQVLTDRLEQIFATDQVFAAE